MESSGDMIVEKEDPLGCKEKLYELDDDEPPGINFEYSTGYFGRIIRKLCSGRTQDSSKYNQYDNSGNVIHLSTLYRSGHILCYPSNNRSRDRNLLHGRI